MTAPGPDLATLLARLEQQNDLLARQNRWLKRCFAAAVVLGAALWVAAGQAGRAVPATDPPGDRTVNTSRFVVRDQQGKPRLTLGMYKGGPQLALFDASGREQARLGANDDGPHLIYSDSKESPRMALGSSDAGCSLHFIDWSKKLGSPTRISIETGSDDLLELFDVKGGRILGVSAKDRTLTLYDEKGRPAFQKP